MRVVRVLVLCLLPSLVAAQPVQLVHAFNRWASNPDGGLVQTADGSFYGVTRDTIYRRAPGGTITTVAQITDGANASGQLLLGQNGLLYGTTRSGGRGGNGTVFRFDPSSGALSTLHAFEGAVEGVGPIGGLVEFGLTLYGVTPSSISPLHPGTLFAVGRNDGTLHRVMNFTGALAGLEPSGPLTLCGLSLCGVARSILGTGPGVLYRFNLFTSELTIRHTFTAGEGAEPRGALVVAPDATLYGTTVGNASTEGTIFRFDPVTGTLSVIYTFGTSSLPDGISPGPLTLAADGHLYGITAPSPVFGAEPARLFRVRRLAGGAHAFDPLQPVDYVTVGRPSDVTLTQGADGLLYGYAQLEGPLVAGSIYTIDPAGGGPPSNPMKLNAIYAFLPESDWQPSTPVLAPDGFLYGTTSQGGSAMRGAVYRLDAATGALSIIGAMPGYFSGTTNVANSPLQLGADGRLYGASASADRVVTEYRLVRVETSGATTESVVQTVNHGSDPMSLTALVRNPAGDLFFLRDQTLVHYRPAAATLTTVGGVPAHGAFGRTEMTPLLAANGQVYVGISTTSDVGTTAANFVTTTRLFRLNTATDLLEEVMNLGTNVGAVSGLVQGTDGGVYLSTEAGISRVDVNAGSHQPVCGSPDRIRFLTAAGDGTLFAVLAASDGPQRLLRCTPAAGLSTLSGLPDALGHIAAPLVAVGDFLYGATSGGTPVSGGQPGGAIFRLAVGGVLPAIDTDADGLENTWETTFGLSPFAADGADGAAGDPDGDGLSNAQELAAGTHPRGFSTRYFAEGATGTFFRTRFDLSNPNGGHAALVFLRFATDTGARVSREVVVPAGSHVSVDPATLPGLAHASFSTVVESDEVVAIDRTMEWAGGAGSHLETSLPRAHTTWHFAEGSTSGAFSLFYLLQNPHATAVTATVRYLRPAPQPPIEKVYTLPPTSRTTIVVDAQGPELASTDVSAAITASAPIVAERAMYFDRPGQPFAAGHESAGIEDPSGQWFFAEGATGSFFDLFLLLSNPRSTPANIVVDYLMVGGGVLTKAYTVPANARLTIWVDDEELPAGSGQKPLANTSLSIGIRGVNGAAVVAERTMWWPGPALTTNFWYEAHNARGVIVPSTRWAIGGGESHGPDAAQTYLLIANPIGRPGRARVTLLSDIGASTVPIEVDLPASSRTNVASPTGITGTPNRFGYLVESIGDAPVWIVVERATYTSPGGVTWAAGGATLGTLLAPTLP